jgi:ADP-heptose:LPS heptosyltransferase
MRVLASNPDTIGDVLLRQPMYRAIMEAGHDLCLIIRPLLDPLIRTMVPGAKVIVCREPLYEPGLQPTSATLDTTAEEARRFGPEVLLIAPFQWTALEERLSIDFPGVPCIAMTGKRFMDPHFGPVVSRLRVTKSVPVAEADPELAKNAALAGAVLERPLELPDPTLTPDPDHLARADSELEGLGLHAGGYLVACVGDARFTRVRNWEPRKWAALLSHWSQHFDRRILFIGLESEMDTVREVMGHLPDPSRSVIWAGTTDDNLPTLVGLIARSAAYAGRDTGPMHIAAALGRPVLAVFGGGTWPRFLPAVSPSVCLTVEVPCSGCGWQCHLARSHCIKDVPVEAAIAAAEDLESGRVTGREVRALPADPALLASMARAGAEVARERLIELSILQRRPVPDTRHLEEALERALKSAARADALAEELESLRREASRREALLRQRLAAQENAGAAREADLKAKLRLAEEQLARPMITPEQLAAIEAAHRQRESELNGHLVRALAELNRRESAESDLRLKLERLESDRRTLGTLTQQQEAEVVVLRERVNDLLASRWRRYGQRLGLCMKLPWESQNGQH